MNGSFGNQWVSGRRGRMQIYMSGKNYSLKISLKCLIDDKRTKFLLALGYPLTIRIPSTTSPLTNVSSYRIRS